MKTCSTCNRDLPLSEVKVAGIAGMVSPRSRYSLNDIRAEIAKCDVVCANCHRMRTATRGGWSALNQTSGVPAGTRGEHPLAAPTQAAPAANQEVN